jgi:hypothetical protein
LAFYRELGERLFSSSRNTKENPFFLLMTMIARHVNDHVTRLKWRNMIFLLRRVIVCRVSSLLTQI